MSRRAFLIGTAATLSNAALGKSVLAQTASAPGATNYFPADPGVAPFPSPEGSMIMVVNKKIYLYDSAANLSTQRDNAYLRDAQGTILTFKLPLDLAPSLYGLPQGYTLLGNDGVVNKWFSGSACQICQGKAWVKLGPTWFYDDPATHGSAGNTALLPPYQPAKGQQYVPASATSTGSTTPVMPSAPTRVSPAPGSTGKVIKVGPTQAITRLTTALAAAQNGDTIRLDDGAVFKEAVVLSKAVKIVSGGVTRNQGKAEATWAGGAKIDVTGVAPAQGKGALVPTTDVIFEGLEITGAGLNESTGGGTAGIRNGGSGNFVVRNCFIHDNQDGIFSGGYAATWVLENNLIRDNGIGDGQTHNIYLGREVVEAEFRNNTSIIGPSAVSALRATGMGGGGHAYKCRANISTFTGGYGRAAETVVDLPDGSTKTVNINGMTMEKSRADASHRVMDYAVESGVQGVVGVIVSACNFVLNCSGPFVQVGNGGNIVFDSSNTWLGNKPTPSGMGTVTGLPK